MKDTQEYKTVCNVCYRKIWYETEQACHCTKWMGDEQVPCTGTLKVIDNSELNPRLTQYYKSGQRIEITYKDGTTLRAYVGKSTGWKPCYLEILKSNSWGGGSFYLPEDATIRELNKYK